MVKVTEEEGKAEVEKAHQLPKADAQTVAHLWAVQCLWGISYSSDKLTNTILEQSFKSSFRLR